MALVDLSVVEQRYRAVLLVLAGASVSEVAAGIGVSRQSLHTWVSRYRESGLAGLTDRSRRPDCSPSQMPARVETVVCELRREHPRWGPVRLVHEIGRLGVEPVPSRMGVYRALVRHGLVQPGRGRKLLAGSREGGWRAGRWRSSAVRVALGKACANGAPLCSGGWAGRRGVGAGWAVMAVGDRGTVADSFGNTAG